MTTVSMYRAKRRAVRHLNHGQQPPDGRGPVFVVHQHDATRMHWDLRLEIDGVLCSWAVPKEPSMDPEDKRLAVKVENHPLEYVHFEAVIPDGNYGAGPMIAWDRGLFRPLVDPAQGLVDGEIKFELYGYKLRGAFTLVHTGKGRRGQRSGRGRPWLLIKKRDELPRAVPRGKQRCRRSVLSGLDDRRAAGAPAHQLARRRDREARPRGARSRRVARADAVPDRRRAFSSDDWVFELKYDGFRIAAFAAPARRAALSLGQESPTGIPS
jgi:bifunctional non-homologous end joining protein LigD